VGSDVIDGRFPNLFLVGAPKCGTTALYRWLGSHPEVFMCRKEPHYFGSDQVWRFGPRRTLDSYLRLFADATSQRYLGDASPWYLYSQLAAREIHAMAPDARILAMVRNPVDQMHSHHSQGLRYALEELDDFEAAIDAEADRKEGRRIPALCKFPPGLFYRDVADLAPQLARYFDAFGRDRVHVVVHDDLERDAGAVYRQVLEFLEIDPDHRAELGVVNPNRRVRSRRVVEFFARPPGAARAIARALIRDETRRQDVRNRVRRLTLRVEPRPPVDPALRARLQRELDPKIRALEALLDRDLSAWRRQQESISSGGV
jgi:hypothetical protein